uniref:Secreted protein n=1 Tax=Rhodosorus marinus TaxID=101924 RepID=A0A7S2ZEB0_9RHOD
MLSSGTVIYSFLLGWFPCLARSSGMKAGANIERGQLGFLGIEQFWEKTCVEARQPRQICITLFKTNCVISVAKRQKFASKSTVQIRMDEEKERKPTDAQ